MDATSTFDLGGMSGAALGNLWGTALGVALLIVATALVLRRVIEAAPATEPVAETAAA